MAIPNPPTKPPARPPQGNSQQVAVRPDAVQQKARPREMNPVAAEYIARYAQVWEENDRLREENVQLVKENEVLQKLDIEKSALIESLRTAIKEAQKVTDDRLRTQEMHFRDRLSEADRAKERYLRYAVSISTDIKSCISSLEAADHTAMEMAHSPSGKVLEDVDKAIADTVSME